MLRSDFHIHTSFSTDSNAPMEDVIKRSIALGLTDIAITDHMDFDFPEDVAKDAGGNFMFDVKEHHKVFTGLNERFSRDINLYYGIEMGFMDNADDFYNNLLKTYPFDFNIGSLHIVDDMDPYFQKYWDNMGSAAAGIERYLSQMLSSIKRFKNYDSLGHADYIFRVAPGKKEYEYGEYADYFDEILKILITDGKALEVNTAGYKYGLGVPNPRPCVLRRYKELGGELITVGSDAHAPEQLAYDYKKCEALLKELGYKYVFIYKDHKPEGYTI
ncbi:MAG: histidinol-phosphatase HisJ family protein [Lachnospiraceae bacterium]|nr:histidinol-phosphatase HisJ family protein [Lachnospiraceae bacterium]